MKLATMISAMSLLGLALTASIASAQPGDESSQQGGMGMMKGMGMGGMGMGGRSEGSGSADPKQGGCGMMNKMSALQERVNQLEQRLNATQAPSPAKPQ